MSRKFFAALIGVVLAVAAFTGCSFSPSAQWANALKASGFGEPTVVTGSSLEGYVILAQAGSCQVRFVVSAVENRIYATVPGEDSRSTEDASFVGDPSLEGLKRDDRFAACFAEGESPSPSPSPGG